MIQFIILDLKRVRMSTENPNPYSILFSHHISNLAKNQIRNIDFPHMYITKFTDTEIEDISSTSTEIEEISKWREEHMKLYATKTEVEIYICIS